MIEVDIASVELCKELFEVSGWDGTFFNYSRSSHYKDAEPDHPFVVGYRGSIETREVKERYPAYDMGYLMRKFPVLEEGAYVVLPEFNGYKIKWSGWETEEGFYINGNTVYFDCPEDAMVSMAIELIKQGKIEVGKANNG